MSGHRRSRSRHRSARGRHRTLARGGRVGIMLGAVATTGAVAVLGFGPYAKPWASSAVSDETDGHHGSSLLRGVGLVADGVEGSSVEPRGSDDQAPVPERSGRGRRVVFDMSDQRVWMIRADQTVHATHLVSGSTTDNLQPGSYRVYSRSRHAVGYDLHSTMQYFVRFARGDSAAIGFHDIPVDNSGQRVQTADELGTPQSAGCIRQRRSDARTMWRFADDETRVVVVR